ncbi:hypothetical protein Lesp01_32700 [Lentzea sp. NBRC 102530]|nr:hypothetical protein Lesp01_32700 [Lentzea sp. NBRC 102530]
MLQRAARDQHVRSVRGVRDDPELLPDRLLREPAQFVRRGLDGADVAEARAHRGEGETVAGDQFLKVGWRDDVDVVTACFQLDGQCGDRLRLAPRPDRGQQKSHRESPQSPGQGTNCGAGAGSCGKSPHAL